MFRITRLLYTKDSIVFKLFSFFRCYFLKTSKPTQNHLFLVILSVLCLDYFRSVRFAFHHVISKMDSGLSLNSFYYTLDLAVYDEQQWRDVTAEQALAIIPDCDSDQPVFLSIDDTMAEKFGKKFEGCSKLYDHANHNGSCYLDGHCFVSVLLSVPVRIAEKMVYISVPIGYRMWTKEESKLAMAAQMVRQAMAVIDSQKPVFLLCDSWYPKGEILGLVTEFENLELICNVRTDTVLYDLPSAPTGKRGRPRKRGDRISLESFPLSEVDGTDYCIGTREVKTRLFGERTVYAYVTQLKKGTARRLFLCTANPNGIPFHVEECDMKEVHTYCRADRKLLPLALYSIRWNIEISYYEGKTFWAMDHYMLRSKKGIERLVNLISISYSAMTLLPFAKDFPEFAKYRTSSAQETRFEIGSEIRSEIIMHSFVEKLESQEKWKLFTKALKKLISQHWSMIQKL